MGKGAAGPGPVPLSESEEAADLFDVSACHQSCLVEVAFTFLRFFCQDVAVISMLTLNLSRAGEREALL